MSTKETQSIEAPRLLIWLRRDQETLAAQVVEAMGARVVGVGGPEGRIESDLCETHVDDLRAALQSVECDAALLLASAEADALDDAELMARCAERGALVASLAPSLAPLRDEQDRPSRRAALTPLMRRSPGLRAAREALEAFAPVETVGVALRCGHAEGDLAARLVDAMDLIHLTLGEPESIDASICGPRAASGLRLSPGDALRDLRGSLSAHLRYADGRSAALTITDNAGHWFRGATLLGERGCLRLDERGFEWIDPGGAKVEQGGQTSDGTPASGARAIAEDLSLLLADASAPGRIADPRSVLAMAHAAMLSARTLQPESPATILRMLGAA